LEIIRWSKRFALVFFSRENRSQTQYQTQYSSLFDSDTDSDTDTDSEVGWDGPVRPSYITDTAAFHDDRVPGSAGVPPAFSYVDTNKNYQKLQRQAKPAIHTDTEVGRDGPARPDQAG